jgi:prevent-host-death family protein
MRVSVKELLRNFSLLSDKALSEPVIITKNGRDRLVLVGVEEYLMLKDMTEGGLAESAPANETDDGPRAAAVNAKPKRV